MGTKISALAAAAALGGFEKIPSVQGGGDVALTPTQIKTFVLAALVPIATSGSAADLSAGTVPAARLPALSGDISTSAGSVVTAIGANKVTRGMLAQASFASFVGATAAGNVTDLTVAQSKALLALTAADLSLAVTTQAATTYTLVLADQNTYIRFTNGSPVTVTIPTNASVAYPIGTEVTLEQAGAGALTVAAAGGVALNSRGADFTLFGQYSVATIKKVATDTWTLVGDL